MKTKNTKTCYRSYENFELDSLAAFLEEQAAEGWELTSKLGRHLGFRRCEPKKVKINVEFVYANDSDYEREEYADYCKAAGWERIFHDEKIQIFENADPEAEPISTDPKPKFDSIRRHMRNTSIAAILIFAVLMFIGWQMLSETKTINDYMSNGRIMFLFTLGCAAFVLFAFGANYFLWYRGAKKAVAMGEHPRYTQSVFSRYLSRVSVVIVFLGIWGNSLLTCYFSRDWVFMTVFLAAGIAMSSFIVLFSLYDARHNKRRKQNIGGYLLSGIGFLLLVLGIAALIIFNSGNKDMRDDNLALTMEDLGIETTDYRDRSVYYEGSFILQKDCGDDQSKNEKGYRLWYNRYTTKNEKAYQSVFDFISSFSGLEEISDPAFDANTVYQTEDGEIVLLYPEAVVELHTNIPLTDTQKDIIGVKLGNADR